MLSFGTFSYPIGISKRSEGIDGKVGCVRFTSFHIPVAPVYVECDGNESLTKPIQEALQRAGYRVSFVESEKSPLGPTPKYQFKQFWFNHHAWILPLMAAWGDMGLTTGLLVQSGKPLWSK